MFAVGGVFAFANVWPDVIVAAILGWLVISAAWQILKAARSELSMPKCLGCGKLARMKLLKLHRLLRRVSVTALSLCFAVAPLSASYHACEMEPPAKQEVQADMAGIDCASMDMSADSQPKAEKQCCIDFSCPKCFSSPLATVQQETIAAPVEHAVLVREDGDAVVSHPNSGIDRPPKIA